MDPFFATRAEFLSAVEGFAGRVGRLLTLSQISTTESTFKVYVIPETRHVRAYMNETRLHEFCVFLEADYWQSHDFWHWKMAYVCGNLHRAVPRFSGIFGFNRMRATSLVAGQNPEAPAVSAPVELDYSGFAPAAGWPVLRTLSSYAPSDTREITMHHRVHAYTDRNGNVMSVVFNIPDAAVQYGRHDLYELVEGAHTTGRYIGYAGQYNRTFELTAPVELLDAIEAGVSPNEA